MLFRYLSTGICSLALVVSVQAASVTDSRESTVVKLRNSLPGQVPKHNNEYELAIYRLPAGAEVAKLICGQIRKCEKKVKGVYTFHAFSSKFDQLDGDLVRLNVSRLQQYAVSANYELTLGKYFSVTFKKSGSIGEGMLFEDVSFVVRPVSLNAGEMNIDVFGLFKYHLLGSGQKISPSGRAVRFASSISQSKNFLLIAEAQAQTNEPGYLAVIKQCDEILTPSYEVKMLEKGL